MSQSITYCVRVLIGFVNEQPVVAERTYRAQTPKLAEAITRRYYRQHMPTGTVITVLSVKRAEE